MLDKQPLNGGCRSNKNRMPLWGILGGMGPLASMEFLNTIYRLNLEQVEREPEGKEQLMARVILVSDPDVPDRTEAIEELHAGNPQQFHEVNRRLKQLLEALSAMQVDRIVIPCVTAHFFLPFLNLPTPLAASICSLTATVRDALLREHGKYILLRTNGTWRERIFENQPG
jgi:aspartate racemase